MIQNLLARIILVLRDAFTGILADPAAHVGPLALADPSAGALPFVGLSAGHLEIEPLAKDRSSSEPRPQEFVQEIAINPGSPLGPYPLAKTPLQKSALCKVSLAKGTVDERQILLVEGGDFQIDYKAATFSFARKVPGATTILLRYSFPGIFTIQDFSQDFHLTVFAVESGAVEQWAALASCVILTSQDDLLNYFNQTAPTTYTAGAFVSTHTLSKLHAVGGTPTFVNTGLKLDCTFRVLGQMKLTREISDGFGLIERVRSPGRTSGAPVDIDIGLG